MNPTRPEPFPGIPADQPVGPMGRRRQMETFNSVTLAGMAKGQAGEPEHVVTLARQILEERRKATAVGGTLS